MLLRDLDEKNAAYDAEHWKDCDALYAGGRKFRSRISRFLPQNPQEPDGVYYYRKDCAHYRSYLGPIIDYFVAWLFTATMDIRTKSDEGDAEPLPEFYSNWKEEVSRDRDLTDFIRERMTRALVEGASYWIVEMPSDGGVVPESTADYEARGLGNGKLRPVERCDIWDWECDDDGCLQWVSIHSEKTPRPSPGVERDTVIETWRIYDLTSVSTYVLQYKKGQRPKDPKTEVPMRDSVPHRCKEVPLVCLMVPEGLQIAERVFSAQLEHFRAAAGLSWAIKRTCYSMPVFKMEDGKQNPPTMGTGYYMMIGPNDEVDWLAPPTESFDVIAREVDAQRDEIYRITHQMALGVDNNAAAVGRSAESKSEDAASTQVMLNAYGALIREAVEETFEILSDARGDTGTEFSVEGLDKYDAVAATGLIDNVSKAILLAIPSETFNREIKTRAALALVPDASQTVKDLIKAEIEAGVSAETELSSLVQQNDMALEKEGPPEFNDRLNPPTAAGKRKTSLPPSKPAKPKK